MVYSRGTASQDRRARVLGTCRLGRRAGREGRMHFGAFFYGTVDMPDAGVDGPPAHARNYGQESYRRGYDDLIGYAQACDTLGHDSMWTAGQHFHDRGFGVVPNVVPLDAVL